MSSGIARCLSMPMLWPAVSRMIHTHEHPKSSGAILTSHLVHDLQRCRVRQGRQSWGHPSHLPPWTLCPLLHTCSLRWRLLLALQLQTQTTTSFPWARRALAGALLCRPSIHAGAACQGHAGGVRKHVCKRLHHGHSGLGLRDLAWFYGWVKSCHASMNAAMNDPPFKSSAHAGQPVVVH